MGNKRASRQQTGNEDKVPWWQVSKGDGDSKERDQDSLDETNFKSTGEILHDLTEIYAKEPVTSPTCARKALRKLATVVAEGGPLHAGLHDIIQMYAATEKFFEQTAYQSFKAHLANVRCIFCMTI